MARAGGPQDQLSARARFDVAEGREEGGAELERCWEAEWGRGWEAERGGPRQVAWEAAVAEVERRGARARRRRWRRRSDATGLAHGAGGGGAARPVRCAGGGGGARCRHRRSDATGAGRPARTGLAPKELSGRV